MTERSQTLAPRSERPLASDIEDSYELSPMQQGMLYHTLAAPLSGVYCIVVSYRLLGPLDSHAFERAWQASVARHPILRTSFHWQDLSAPVQRVHACAPLPISHLDWSGLSRDEQQQRLLALVEEQSARGFDLATPPLLRLALIRCAREEHQLVVAHHHLLMDGSCKPALFDEVFALYGAFCEQRPLELQQPGAYREFIEWLREQNLVEAEGFWRREFERFARPTPLWPDAQPAAVSAREYAQHQVELGTQPSDRLRLFARRRRLTINSVVTGMWALLLSHSSGQEDVVFGATVNARPPALAGSEPILGLFINTLPIRVSVARPMPVAAWLQLHQTHQAAVREYDFTPLSTIQRWSGIARRQPLFESIVVFENNAGYGSATERYGAIEIRDVRPHVRNSFPLTVRCVPGPSLSIQILYETCRFADEAIARVAEQLVELLSELPDCGDAPVSMLLGRLAERERERSRRQATAFDRTVREKLRLIHRERREGRPL